MTPKEKAKELVDNFYDIDSDAEMYDDFKMPIFYAERCALIAVDEILLTLNNIKDRDVRGNILLDLIKYWQEVKKEIEKL